MIVCNGVREPSDQYTKKESWSTLLIFMIVYNLRNYNGCLPCRTAKKKTHDLNAIFCLRGVDEGPGRDATRRVTSRFKLNSEIPVLSGNSFN